MKALLLRSLLPLATLFALPLPASALWGAPDAGAGLEPAVPQTYAGYPQVPGPMANDGSYTPTTYGDGSYAPQGVQGGYAPQGVAPAGAMFAPQSMLTYGTLEGFYQYTQWKTAGIDDAHGMGLSLMAELFNPFFIHGAFTWGTGNGAALPSSYNISTVSVGGGGHLAITDRFHLMGEIGGIYASLSADKTNVSFSDGAVYISPGIRFAATESLELKLGLTATSADKYDSKVLDLGAYYKIFSQMDVGVGLTKGDETKAYKAGVRFRW